MLPDHLLPGAMCSVNQSPVANQPALAQHDYPPHLTSKPDYTSDSRRHSDSRVLLHESLKGPGTADSNFADGETAQEQCSMQIRGNLSSHSPRRQEPCQVSRWDSPNNKLYTGQRKAASSAAPSQKSAAHKQGEPQQMQTSDLKPLKSAAAEDLGPLSKAAFRPQMKGKQQAVATRLLDRHVDQTFKGQAGFAKAKASQTVVRGSGGRAYSAVHGSELAQLTRPGSNKRKSPDLHSPSLVSGYETDINLEAGRKVPRQDSVPGLPDITQRPYERLSKGWKNKSKEQYFLPECDLSPRAASSRATDVRRLPNQVFAFILEA